MIYVICNGCKQRVSKQDFQRGNHVCIRRSQEGSPIARWKRLLKSGGCTRAEYDAGIAKLEQHNKRNT